MQNKRGFTLIEIAVTFSLVAVVSILLFQIVISLREVYIKGDLQTTLLTKQGIMTKKINDDLQTLGLSSITNCGEFCITLKYRTGASYNLSANIKKNQIQYHDYVWQLPEGITIGNIEKTTYENETTNDSILKIEIPVTHKLLEHDYGVHFIYQLGSNKNTEVVCAYEIGQAWEFVYNKEKPTQDFTTPCNGTYKLEVYGAQGGSVRGISGGLGGYSHGNIELTRNTNLYVVVGSSGDVKIYDGNNSHKAEGGYNGGGFGRPDYVQGQNSFYYASGGGGATHIAITNLGELRNYNNNQNDVIIVAGGGGGSGGAYQQAVYQGGTGGGTTGGNATSGISGRYANGGTQTESSGFSNGGFGFGCSATSNSGGGGGWYGGSCGGYGGGAGGSGYLNTSLLIKGTTNTENGVQSGNGYAKITLVSLP